MKEIKLTQNQIALVDDADFEWLTQWKWSAAKNWNGTFHAISKVGGKKVISMHRLLCGSPSNMVIDHKDHNTLNNQRYNLRPCTRQQNRCNILKKVGKSKFLGVNFERPVNRWRARIFVNKKSIHLGLFDSEKEAAKAYNEAAKKYHGEFANPNLC